MRSALAASLVAHARKDERIWLLTGDLGYSVLEEFADSFPDRFVNAGIAEQNMMGMAAGLALSGRVPFVYSIANFPVARCLEQIRNDVCLHALSVKVVSVGAGVAYGTAGYTHHGLEDLAIMRAMPGMAVLCPADPYEAAWSVGAAVDRPGPVYIRLGRNGTRPLHSNRDSLEFGRAALIRDGSDCALVSTGTAMGVALDAAELLSCEGVSARVLGVLTVKPLDVALIRAAAIETGLVATIEEHGPTGGLFSAVVEALATQPGVRCLGHSLREAPQPMAGSSEFLHKSAGLDAHSVARNLLEGLGRA